MGEPRQGLSRWTVRALAAAFGLAGVTHLATDQPAPRAATPLAPAPAVPGDRLIATAAAPIQLAGLGRHEVRSLLNVREPMRYGQSLWQEDGVPAGPLQIRVDRARQILSVFRGGHEIGTAVILYGAPEKPTPAGRYPILAKKRYHVSNSYGAEMPYTLWLTEEGVAIHGSAVRQGAATHGCIGLPRDFAARLFDAARPGDPVVIV